MTGKRKTIFISGSAYEYGHFGDTGKDFIRDLSKRLLKNNLRLISGFGAGVGNYIIEGAMEIAYLEKQEKITDQLLVFPFPANHHESDMAGLKNIYREEMITKAESAIFLFGNKLEEISIREADGMLHEFEIASAAHLQLVPVGACGYISEKLWKKLIGHYDDYFDSREKYNLYQQLGDTAIDPDTLIDLIIRIIE
jgi:hypothetical protein